MEGKITTMEVQDCLGLPALSGEMMKIAILDGQGGGIGKHIVSKLRQILGHEVEIIALGTNALATSNMLRAGANEGATGENAIIRNAARVDVITGSVMILAAHSMAGELTPGMAEAIAASDAVKFLLPVNKARIELVGIKEVPLPHQIDDLVERIKSYWRDGHV